MYLLFEFRLVTPFTNGKVYRYLEVSSKSCSQKDFEKFRCFNSKLFITYSILGFLHYFLKPLLFKFSKFAYLLHRVSVLRQDITT
jgi:hypothetical protein